MIIDKNSYINDLYINYKDFLSFMKQRARKRHEIMFCADFENAVDLYLFHGGNCIVQKQNKE